MARRRRSKNLMTEINVVPYIDVMLVLLIIFMITTPLLTQGVNVNLPEANAKTLDSKQKEPLIVSIDANGQYYLNANENPAEPLKPEALINKISADLLKAKEANEEQSVLIKGDKALNYGQIMKTMVLLQQAGVSNVGLMTQAPDDTTG